MYYVIMNEAWIMSSQYNTQPMLRHETNFAVTQGFNADLSLERWLTAAWEGSVKKNWWQAQPSHPLML